mmetsp:Transcript_31431/g.36875  ORF Transcript_31431/g.36875 Transcript_31431/m.36875 type:complete len:202 (-) Transcript_31431:112-717(-)
MTLSISAPKPGTTCLTMMTMRMWSWTPTSTSLGTHLMARSAHTVTPTVMCLKSRRISNMMSGLVSGPSLPTSALPGSEASTTPTLWHLAPVSALSALRLICPSTVSISTVLSTRWAPSVSRAKPWAISPLSRRACARLTPITTRRMTCRRSASAPSVSSTTLLRHISCGLCATSLRIAGTTLLPMTRAGSKTPILPRPSPS